MEEILSLIDPGAIMQLPWHVGVPGLAIIALLILGSVRALLRLRILKAAMRLFLAVFLAIILSVAGPTVAEFISRAPPS